MTIENEVMQLIYASVDESNEALPQESKLSKDPDQLILGEGSELDSLATVSFLADIEQRVGERFSLNSLLTEDEYFLRGDIPGLSIRELAKLIIGRIDESR